MSDSAIKRAAAARLESVWESSRGMFCTLNTNTERVNFLLHKIGQYKLDFALSKDEKDPAKSTEAREIGNRCFAEGKYLSALQLYTESIARAENKSINLALAYANRSAALFKLDLHRECLTVT